MFWSVSLSIIRSFSPYTQQWYMLQSEKRLMMDRGTVRNMQIFIPRINLRNWCSQLVLLQEIEHDARSHERQIAILVITFDFHINTTPVPVAARFKAYVCGRCPAEIVGSNPTGGTDVYLLYSQRSLRRADHSSSGVLWISVSCECCVLSGKGLCDRLITRPEESYRLWCVVVCDLETS